MRRLKPRYHFAACGGDPPTFWEREPFVWDDEGSRISRFLSLGAFGGPSPASGKKPRWFYAFSMSPNAPQPKPANATKNPFTEFGPRQLKRSFDEATGENYIWGNVAQPGKRVKQDQSQNGKPPPGYKCRRCESSEVGTSLMTALNVKNHRKATYAGYATHQAILFVTVQRNTQWATQAVENQEKVANQRHPGGGERGGRGKRGPPKEIDPSECWFCLSNPNLAKHLIVGLGSDCYVTLPKGQIIPTQSAANHVDVPGGGHVLIVPIDHHPTYSTIPSDISSSIIDETEKYKSALQAFYAKHFC
ncbi:hypothetical protein MPER_09859, partial [Moniliophthora perniciosa FA553]